MIKKATVIIVSLFMGLNLALLAGCSGSTARDSDPGQEIYWHIKAAQKGSVSAQALLGSMYYKGDGVDADLKKAYAWYTIAAENKDAASIKFKEKIKKALSAQQLVKAEQIADEIRRTIIKNSRQSL